MVFTNYQAKMIKYQQKYPEEFIIKDKQLYCKLCHVFVTYSRKFFLDSHRNSKKHVELQKNLKKKPTFLLPRVNNSPIYYLKPFVHRIYRYIK